MDEEWVKFIPILGAAAFYLLKSVLQQKKAPPARPPLPDAPETRQPIRRALSTLSRPPVPLVEKKDLSAQHSPVLFPQKKSTKAANLRRLAKDGKSWIVLSEVLQKKFE